MLLVDKIEDINKWLARDFGYFYASNHSTWRVVLAGEQIEKRFVDVTPEGLQLLTPIVQEVKKYQHIKPNYYVLERLVPTGEETDLVVKASYEPAWTFMDRFGNYLPPRYDACKFVIEGIYHQGDKAGFYKKYNDPDIDPNVRQQRIKDMEYKLFGNETRLADQLGLGIAVTDFNQKVNLETQPLETLAENKETVQ